MGGHTMTLLSPSTWENLQTTDDFWWSLDFRALFEAQDVWDEQKLHTGTMTHRKRGNYLHSMRWRTIRKSYPKAVGFLKQLGKLPVHIIEFVALMVNILLYKNRLYTKNQHPLWSPYTPLKIYCDNQATVATINAGFALKIFKDEDLAIENFNFEILCNILFQDILTISIDSPAGQAFLNKELPHLTKKIHLTEVPVLPVYVHTTLCTADHLTRGKKEVLGDTPVRIDREKCIAHFGESFAEKDIQKQVPFKELFQTLSYIQDRISWWRSDLRGLSMTNWRSVMGRN